MSITIPQLFYDLIARVLPGFFFLFTLRLLLHGTGIEPDLLNQFETENIIAAIGKGIGYLFICYFVGWILSAFCILTLQNKIRAEHQGALPKKWKNTSLSEMFQTIRLKNQDAAFRILKLRAEAKLLETTRTGMIFLLGLLILLIVLHNTGQISLEQTAKLPWVTKFFLVTAIIVGLRRHEKPAWHRYYGNIAKLYELVVIRKIKP